MSILVINAGSSSLKFALFEARSLKKLASGMIARSGGQSQTELAVSLPGQKKEYSNVEITDSRSAVDYILEALDKSGLIYSCDEQTAVQVVGHRIVHGGREFGKSVLVDSSVKETISRMTELAPLHNPPAMEAIESVEEALPGIPQVAVFDTAYYCHMPEKSFIYPLPYEWYEEWGIRRFGFHGISHAYCAERAAEMTGDNSTELRIVSCHLGNGCSATATWNSAAVATTMGFTPMEGLMMGTRSGSIDPGILLYLQQSGRLSTEELDHALNHQSGLLGVSGISSDFRQVERASMKGDERARLALDIFADRVRGAIGALAVNMSGIDVLVFTGGIGENSSSLRTMVCKGMECLGLRLDSERNNKCQPDCDIADKGSSVRILVVHTNEELLIAREARRLNET